MRRGLDIVPSLVTMSRPAQVASPTDHAVPMRLANPNGSATDLVLRQGGEGGLQTTSTCDRKVDGFLGKSRRPPSTSALSFSSAEREKLLKVSKADRDEI